VLLSLERMCREGLFNLLFRCHLGICVVTNTRDKTKRLLIYVKLHLVLQRQLTCLTINAPRLQDVDVHSLGIDNLKPVLRIRMNPHDFGLLDPHPESAFQMRIPDADADPG
jgi:hypothetical protein